MSSEEGESRACDLEVRLWWGGRLAGSFFFRDVFDVFTVPFTACLETSASGGVRPVGRRSRDHHTSTSFVFLCRVVMGGNSSDPAAAGSTSAEPSPPLLRSFILVAALPFISISGYAYLYTALPLHVFDSGWPLWHLSILLSVCFVFRLLMSAAVTRLGYWAMVLNAAAMVPLTLFMVISPGNLTFVYIGVFSACTAISTNTYRSLVYEEFHSSDSDWRLQRALRWFTLFDTVGYSFGPFIGGALYDAGRFRLCSQFQLATQIACVVLPLFLTKVQASISSAFSDAARLCLSLRRLPRRSTGIVPDAHPAVEGAVESTTSRAHFSPDPASTKQESPLPIWPIAVILISAFTNIAVYGVEWCLYAIYFRSVFGWSGAAIGAAQMAGDLLGGLVLALSTMSCVTRAAGCFCHASPNFARALLRPPFGIALLLGCHGLLMVLLAQSQFGVALVGQVSNAKLFIHTPLDS